MNYYENILVIYETNDEVKILYKLFVKCFGEM